MLYRVDPKLMTAKLDVILPEIRVTGQYKLSGQIFTLKVDGQGPYWSIISLFNSNLFIFKINATFFYHLLFSS